MTKTIITSTGIYIDSQRLDNVRKILALENQFQDNDERSIHVRIRVKGKTQRAHSSREAIHLYALQAGLPVLNKGQYYLLDTNTGEFLVDKNIPEKTQLQIRQLADRQKPAKTAPVNKHPEQVAGLKDEALHLTGLVNQIIGAKKIREQLQARLVEQDSILKDLHNQISEYIQSIIESH